MSNSISRMSDVEYMQLAIKAAQQNDWPHMKLYSTAEPCCMCQGAILWAGISAVFYGTSIVTLQRLGWRQIEIPSFEVAERTPWANCVIQGGLLAEECDQLFAEHERES